MPRLEDFVFNIRSILPLEFGPAHLPTTEYIRCTLTPLTKHPVVSYVDCFPEDGDSHCHFYIHFSCGWHKHVHRWKQWVWSIQQSCDEHECALIVRYPSLRGINFLADHDDDTWNNSSSIRGCFSPMICMGPFMPVNWNEWRMIICERTHESIIPKSSPSGCGEMETDQCSPETSLLHLKEIE